VSKSEKINFIEGHIIKVHPKEFKKIDKYEGYPDLYDRKEVKIKLNNEETMIAWVYF